jgi:hypothetical protein
MGHVASATAASRPIEPEMPTYFSKPKSLTGSIPAPKRDRGSWHDYIQRHIKTVWATDFFTKTAWTLRGPVVYYVLFFIHLHTHRVHIVGMTPNPDGVWMAQMARNMSMAFGEEKAEFRPTHIIRDHDTKFTAEFRSICISVIVSPVRRWQAALLLLSATSAGFMDSGWHHFET